MKLDAYLSEMGMSKAAFAKLIGVSEEAVRRYVTGERKPDWPVLARIAKHTDGRVSADDFMGEAA